MKQTGFMIRLSTLILGAAVCAAQVDSRASRRFETTNRSFAVADGQVTFDFATSVLDTHWLWFTPRGDDESISTPPAHEDEADLLRSRISFPIDPSSEIVLELVGSHAAGFEQIHLSSCGALMLFPFSDRIVIGNLALGRDSDGGLHVYDTLDALDRAVVFDVEGVTLSFRPADRGFQLDAELVVSQSWATRLGLPEAAGVTIGMMQAAATLTSQMPESVAGPAACAAAGATDAAASTGPDVIVADLQSVQRYSVRVDDITAYAVGTTSCNIGTERANWFQLTNQHPVIIQNVHRLDHRGFQQIGMSWMKHGFYAVSQSLCSPCNDPTNGTQLGVGCSDPYSAPLNGDQYNMSPRATLNAHSGVFPYPWSGPVIGGAVARRIQIHDADLDPELNPQARYFIEGHYLMADDAAAGNADNNASYREVRVVEAMENVFGFIIDPMFSTCRGEAAVRAWQDVDPSVVETDVRVPAEGLFILAAKAQLIEGGWYRYQYALQNLNSDRSARSFSLDLPQGAIVQNAGFRPVNHHSGEPFAQNDWTFEWDETHLAWYTQTYQANENANALRFGSVFAFSFDCNVEPGQEKVYVGLFKPGFPQDIVGNTIGPVVQLRDCNHNQIADACDIDCGVAGCGLDCGDSSDCNGNSVPDECEPDCNQNDIADACDLAACPPGNPACGDCNGNAVPDGCENDCDRDGVPDDCEETSDTDGDGVEDCDDQCPATTPPGTCDPPPFVTCRFNNGICADLPRASCIELSGTPFCGDPPELRCQFGFPCPQSYCRYGCRVGDADSDGDVDLFDVGGLQSCFSGGLTSAAPTRPSAECLLRFDFDEDADVDLWDFKEFCGVMDRQ